MVTKDELTAGWSVEGWPDWSVICELLKTGQYEQLAELLRQANVASERADETLLADILAAAYRICLACGQCHNDVAWHRRAHEEAERREAELTQQLQAILKPVGNGEAATLHELPAGKLLGSATGLSILEPVRTASGKRPGLWQHFLNLFDRWVSLRSSARKAPAGPAELPVEPFVENVPFPEDVETPPALLIETDQLGDQASHSLIVYCLGTFKVYLNDQPIKDWHNGKSKALFKYLVAHHQRPVAKEILMELFWPDANPDAARNNLNVTIYGLRQILRQSHPDFAHILFQDDCYLLNPELQIWVDSEAFLDRFKKAQEMEQRGHQLQAIGEYHGAEELYQGEYMEEDRYDDWLFPHRQKLQDIYLSLLDHLSQYYFDQEHYAVCVSLCRKILTIEPCREDVHRRLMRCYCRQQQRYLGLRQYHQCLEALKDELDVAPSPRTTQLYECIRRHEPV